MAANETAEAFLIVVKRLAKWALWALLAMAILASLVAGGVWLNDKWSNRPYALTTYANVAIGDSREQVKYALGAPESFVAPAKPGTEDQTQDAKILSSADDPLDITVMESPGWLYQKAQHRITAAFDTNTNKVSWIGCYSKSVYECPSVFGLNDGDTEDEVLAHLGKPDRERLDGVTKAMHYDKYNVTFYLVQKKVYMFRVGRPQD